MACSSRQERTVDPLRKLDAVAPAGAGPGRTRLATASGCSRRRLPCALADHTAIGVCAIGRVRIPPSFRNGRISACRRSCGAVSISCRSRLRHPHGTSWRRRARRARHAGVLRASPATGSVLDVDAAADERSGEPTDSSLLDSEHLLRCVRERGRRTGQRAVTAASSSASRPVVSSPSMCAMSQRRWMTASATTASTVPSPKRW